MFAKVSYIWFAVFASSVLLAAASPIPEVGQVLAQRDATPPVNVEPRVCRYGCD
ncbi:hypothetical protein CONPUDRAFT_154404 [Coniophora puteana RWD-64-598 SS2]|uniref:Uncharacterized protein n=1 Tax=Coniophora puteana (strain RWD-64-598) TaxID=741705 RepID=A0A5M3MMC8_CONPW|nr:uncharacterized protein CONPUDRAFT_154404 [Coniophora puteana RWD-64-598 SS2]EIW80372.1 hypothetical protein CONPUDRAFT_154404 [Coniophora puteana RWD-64-598 SS2]